MKPVALNIPASAEIVFNNLYRTNDPALLTADLLGVALPGEMFIDVSWHPERDASGEYTVTVYYKSWDHIEKEFETTSIDQLILAVEAYSREYCKPVLASAQAGQ
ncbi:MAG TPA: hypothetical protein DDY78_21290 [Planctomycetales bacterium]|jgi:hypothetical protein|nr:hypothetical protein [Planctomycetales bacterium]